MDGNAAMIVGYVCFGLASLSGLALAVKQLFWTRTPPPAAAGNGTYDVTRREFEELKQESRSSLHEIRDRLNQIVISIAKLEK